MGSTAELTQTVQITCELTQLDDERLRDAAAKQFLPDSLAGILILSADKA
jgi:hypothetical protein